MTEHITGEGSAERVEPVESVEPVEPVESVEPTAAPVGAADGPSREPERPDWDPEDWARSSHSRDEQFLQERPPHW